MNAVDRSIGVDNPCLADTIAAYKANRNSSNGNQNKASGGAGEVEHIARGCSYKEFLNCQPGNFDGTKGTVSLTRWFEKMESLVNIYNCAESCQVKYATCTLLDGALTWCNSYIKTMGLDAAYETTWEELKKMMTKEYCPRNAIQKMETELWNLTVKGTDVVGYTRRFQELALLCLTMVTLEYKKVELYIWGLTNGIQGKVTSSRPTKIQEVICMAHELMDQVVQAKDAKDADNKRKWKDDRKRNSDQKLYKRHEAGRVYAAGTSNKTGYARTLPLCDK
uniref:Reverse transcriptase domain-containing protein n=1 Tax=Tanacetum cinerariifolium TaxID=118510 RepID=A0A6L2J9E3_TANCI|nr:reverse transcriptase domain-containing protein [Tanacetum cinerariifolium]